MLHDSRGTVKNSESRPTQQKKKQDQIEERSEAKNAQPTQSTINQKKLNKQLAQKRKARQRWWATTGKKLVGAFVIIAVITGVIIGIVLGTSGGASESSNGGGSSTAKPTLMDIGSTSCIPCQQLQPVLESLRADYGNKVNAKFYDAWNTTSGANMATKYSVSSIPTLIFLDANGKEVARMTGYHSYDEIVSKFKSLGWV